MIHAGPAYVTLFTHDGKKLVTAAEDGRASVWQVPSGEPLSAPFLHGGRVRRAKMTPDDRFLLTCNYEGTAQIWNLATGEAAMEPIRTGDVRDVDLRPDGTEFMTSGRDGVVRRWRLAPGAARALVQAKDGAPHIVLGGSKRQDVGWVVYRDRMQAIDISSGGALGPPRIFPTMIQTAYRISPDERYLVVRIDDHIELWDLADAAVRQRILAPTPIFGNLIGGVGFSPDSAHLASIDDTNRFRVWDMASGQLVIGPIDSVGKGLAFSPDGR